MEGGTQVKSIVLAYDDTQNSRRALERAAELAKVFEARVCVVSVAPVLVGAGHGIGPIDPVEPPELHREQLETAKSELGRKGVTAAVQLAVGDPADSILEVAEKEGADLIVLGSGHASFVAEMFGTSVSGSVQRRAHCDVLVVH
jgi:nucleotide-binding universal stress UspA family protein